MICTFFGHREIPSDIYDNLKDTITDLVENQGVTRFLVGHNGGFDRMVTGILKELGGKYSHIRCETVISDMTVESELDTLFPEVLDSCPPRFAIDRRNRWMVERSDIVVAWVEHTWGGAYKFLSLAQRKKLKIINLAKKTEDKRL